MPHSESGTLTISRTISAVQADFKRYLDIESADHAGMRAKLSAVATFGFIATLVYRFGHWTRGIRPWIVSVPFKLIYHLLNFGVQVLSGIRISAGSQIGPGLYIGHFSGIIVHGTLGSQCSIGQGVTIGAKGAGRSNGYPTIGNRVYMGAGSMVIGRIDVGDDVVVGANTVVVRDVPSGYRVVSAPARLLPPRQCTTPPRRRSASRDRTNRNRTDLDRKDQDPAGREQTESRFESAIRPD